MATKTHPYRMKDLCEQTGLGRQAVHFYILQGLLPEGEKTGRNMAYYSQAHVDRLRLIRRLQEEHFLPLKAIRAVLDAYEDQADFSPAQRQFLDAVKLKLKPVLGLADEAQAMVPVQPLLARINLPREDFDELVNMRLVTVTSSGDGQLMRKSDMWMPELFAELRQLGFSRALGFSAHDLALVDELVTALFRRETALISQRLAHLDAASVATLVEAALPFMNKLLVRLHESKLRNFIAGL
jgi:DNA-binding transcriptional MerR regulator